MKKLIYKEPGVRASCGGVTAVALCLSLLSLTSYSASYYVNNTSTNGNVYTTAVGNDTNDGLTPSTPKLTVTNLLASYTLTSGDVVYIDTGTYSNYTIVVSSSGASSTNPVIFRGSTNTAAGGTVFNRGSAAADVWSFTSISNVVLCDMILTGGRDGVSLSGSRNITIEKMLIRNNSRHGVFAFSSSHNTLIQHSVMTQNGNTEVRFSASTNCSVVSSVLWGTLGVHHQVTTAFAHISNSVLRASGFGNFIYRRESPISADNNLYVLDDNAALGSSSASPLNATPRLSDWQNAYEIDTFSTVLDPQFADAANFDFHPRSQFGRFVNGTFTNDLVTSPLIDMGARSGSFTNETGSNGGRLNVGRYGNTSEASRSSTNRTILALTFNDGGIISGTGRVAWAAGNAQPGDTVRLEYSLDGGATWGIIATNVTATNDMAWWNTTVHGSSGAAKWRVRYEAFTNIVSTNVGYFSVRNTNIIYYINDSSVTGDVYTTAIGNVTNIATASSPKDNIFNLIANHTLSPGDTVYLDTGTYNLTNTLTLTYREKGSATNALHFFGSTNSVAGKSVIDRQNSSADIVVLTAAPGVTLCQLELRGGRIAISAQQSSELTLDQVIMRNNSVSGIDILGTSPNITIRNSSFINNAQRASNVGATNVVIANCLLYGPRGFTTQSSGSMTVYNNIINITDGAGAAYESLLGVFLSPPDYNLFWLENGSAIAKSGATTYSTLSEYQKTFNREWHSTVRNPLFANPATNDFHVQSAAGRWFNGTFTNDLQTSPAIDLGNPASPWNLEPPPNGARVNAGSFGNTDEASKSLTNAWLLALTYTDGGVLNVPTDFIYWNWGGNFPTGATVRIELSTDGGFSWGVAQTNIAVTNGFYQWANTNFGSSRLSRWRVVYEDNPVVVGAVSSNFVFRNGPFKYYLNDQSTAGDIFTTAIGSDANPGTSGGSPKSTLKNLVDNHPVQPGDIIYVDTGTYSFPVNQDITTLDSGDTNDFIYIVGSTNEIAGGTVFRRGTIAGGAYAISLTSAKYISIQDMTFRDSGVGIYADGAEGLRLIRVRAVNNSVAGINVRNASNVVMRHVAAWNNSEKGIHIEGNSRVGMNHLVLWRNTLDGIRMDSGFASLSNSVIVASGVRAQAYNLNTLTNLAANYNNILLESNAVVAVISQNGLQLDSLGKWSGDTRQDTMSISEEPLFASPSAGDFHLRSSASQGRYLPGVGFVIDSASSSLIDAGAPSHSFAEEPPANGGRVNIGYYGNTTEASKSITNASLLTGSLRQGGVAQGTSTLHWIAYNLPTSHLVTVSYTPDGGATWVNIATGVSAMAESVLWNTTVVSNSPAGLWRIASESDPSLVDQTSEFFSIRNSPLQIFINDGSTVQDIYTTAPGNATNWAASRTHPLNSLALANQRYNLEPGDTLFVDTGTYTMSPQIWSRRNSGATNQHISIVGSTNGFPSASTISGTSITPGNQLFTFSGIRGISISNMAFTTANTALRFESQNGLRIDMTRFAGLSNGLVLVSATNTLVHRVWMQNILGVGITHSGHTVLSNRISHSMFASNATAIIQSAGHLAVNNSIIQSYGANAFVYQVQSNGIMRANFNNIQTFDGASVARFGFSIGKALSRWRDATTNDIQSLSHEPLFNDPASGDYHVASPAGRFDPTIQDFVFTDTVLSPMVDTGDPASPFGEESGPNGARANIGLFGNHPEASRSTTDPRLLTLTLNDGGSTRGTNVLYWSAGGTATGMLVYIDYSWNGGTTWTNVATNISGAAESYAWNTIPYPSSAQGLWRITSQSDPSVAATNAIVFAVNNTPLAYYVNDAVTDGDIYTFAPGNAENDGLTESTPVDDISRILSRYDLQPGDRILVDTGFYTVTNNITFDSTRITGVATNPIRVIGSTNTTGSGTIIDRRNGSIGFEFLRVHGIELNHITITNVANGIRAITSTNLTFNFVTVQRAGNGFEIIGSESTVFSNCVAMNCSTNGLANLNSTGTVWQSGVLWSNATAIRLGSGPSGVPLGLNPPQNRVSMSNSVVVGYGSATYAYRIESGNIVADYNCIFLTNGAQMALVSSPFYNFIFDSVSRWRRSTTQDVFTLTSDPLFHNAAGRDFHPLSQAGRYDRNDAMFVNDDITSPLLDAGNPAWDFVNEGGANGSRINIGRYGNTWLASRTPTNSSATFISLNDGGRISGSDTIHWVTRGASTGHTLRLDVSIDAGANYTIISTNIAGNTNMFLWNSTNVVSGLRTVFRLIDLNANQQLHVTKYPFAVRNHPVIFYVNDHSTSGDVYTISTGSFTNSGLVVSQPKSSLQHVFDAWDVDEGDVIYVDTGIYTNTSVMTLNQLDSGLFAQTGYVHIIGSTNVSAGESVLVGPANQPVLFISNASGINLRNLKFTGSPVGLRIWRSNRMALNNVTTKGGTYGIELDGTRDVEISRSLILNAGDSGLFLFGASNTTWQSGLMWSNQHAVSIGFSTNFLTTPSLQTSIRMSNTIFGAFGSSARMFNIAIIGAEIYSDYNSFYLTNGALIASIFRTNPVANVKFVPTVTDWISETTNDQFSLSRAPLFHNPGSDDFRLRSQAGRFNPSTGAFDIDMVTSPLIDAGHPNMPFAAETSPNGGRINIGPFGNSFQASRSPTNSAVTLITLNSGGNVHGTNVFVAWTAQGNATGHTVRLQLSVDGGASWTNLGTNLPAVGGIVWNTTNFLSTPIALLRVDSEQEPAAQSQSEQFFSIRNSPISYYVNDASTVGDVYVSAVGHPTNFGISAAAPINSIQAVLDRWDLEPGDTVYVDTGIYTNASEILITQLDAGGISNVNNKVRIIGSTNLIAGGTIIDRGPGGNAIRMVGSGGVQFRNLTIRNSTTGILLDGIEGVELANVVIYGGSVGININLGFNILLDRVISRNNTAQGLILAGGERISVESSILWSNAVGVQLSGSGPVSISNTVFGVLGPNAYAIHLFNEQMVIRSDYNNFWMTNGGRMLISQTPNVEDQSTLSLWVRWSGRDTHSLSKDPLFFDPGNGDFHLMSAAGRYDPYLPGFLNDALTSPLIDAGDPSAPFNQETVPNGVRRNIGLYGNTSSASRTPTNSVLITVSLNDGGRVEQVKELVWVVRGNATGHLVRLEYSADNGSIWSLIASNVVATEQRFAWDTRSYQNSLLGRWRVVSENEPGVVGITDAYFALRNGPLSYYVNDAFTVGDVYTTAPGAATNLGMFAYAPNSSVQNVLDSWDVEPGDVIYVDTGTYTLFSPITIGRYDAWSDVNLTGLASGLTTNRVTIQGSTNEAAGGTSYSRFGVGDLFIIENAPGVALRNLNLLGGAVGIRINQSPFALIEWVRRFGGTVGIDLFQSHSVQMAHNIIQSTSQRGLNVLRSTNTLWNHGITWSNPVSFYQSGGPQGESSLRIQNSIAGAFGSNSVVHFNETGQRFSDYNNFYLTNGAFAAASLLSFASTVTTRYETVSFWSRATGQDSHTQARDPKFVNLNAGDYHLMTTAPSGRYDSINGVWTNDADFSRLIDAGNPLSPFGNELTPNGSRVNIGLYGNSGQASRSPTNGWLVVVSLDDEGSMQGVVTLNWVAGGAATSHLVQIDWSPVGDLAWTNVAQNIPASQGTFSWDTDDFGRAACGKWRVVSQNNTNIYDASTHCKIMRDNTGTIPYFVNDLSIVGDVYSTGPGSILNNGLLPSTPMNSVQLVLDTYKLEPIDIIYIDTGEYFLSQAITVSELDAGSGTNRVTLQGSTNLAMGGSVMNRQVNQGDSAALRLNNVSGLNIRDLTFKGASSGVDIKGSTDITFERVQVVDNLVNGFRIDLSTGIEIKNMLAWRNGVTNGGGITIAASAATLDHGTVVGSKYAVNFLNSSDIKINNSYLSSAADGGRIFLFDSSSGVSNAPGDFNNFHVSSGALIAEENNPSGGNDYFAFMHDLIRESGTNRHTLSHGARFADATNGLFTLRSKAGRPLFNGTVTNDPDTSPMVDTASPLTTYTNEPSSTNVPGISNGLRADVGAYGNTRFAAHSATNPWVWTISLNDGGVISGTTVLYWAAGNFTNDARVRLEFSRNNGAEWSVLASNLPYQTDGFIWDVSGEQVTALGKWRIMSASDTNVVDESDIPFSIKNNKLTIFVNDSTTDGDVYTTAPGSPANSGLTNNVPLLSVEDAFTRYPLGAGDVIYIDSGVYSSTNGLLLNELRFGSELEPILVQGSTNLNRPTIINFQPGKPGFNIVNTRNWVLSDLTLTGAQYGASVFNSINIGLRRIKSIGNTESGFLFNQSVNGWASQCVVVASTQWAVELAASDLRWINGLAYSNRLGGFSMNSSALNMQNSIVHAFHPTSVVFQLTQSSLTGSDYNMFWLSTNALIGRNLQFQEPYVYMSDVHDDPEKSNLHSALRDPLFVNPGSGDFALRSQGGRFTTNGILVTTDTTNSWAIDAGHPSAAFGKESSPNGGRINLGHYGDSPLASRSPTNLAYRALDAVSFSDGGQGSGLVTLYWLSRAFSSTSTVRLEYSLNNQVNWNVAASNFPALTGSYEWDTFELPSSPLVFWRVISEENTNVNAIAGPFILRNGPILFYVNDTNTVGDIYTTEMGSSTFEGLEPHRPKNSIDDIFKAYNLDGGDVIYVDTGVYRLPKGIFVGRSDSGSTSAYVSVIGSTNYSAGGTVLVPLPPSTNTNSTVVITNEAAFVFLASTYVSVGNMTFDGFTVGVRFEQLSAFNVISNVLIRNSVVNGIAGSSSSSLIFDRVIVTRSGGNGLVFENSSGHTLKNSIVWSNELSAVHLNASIINVSNSMLHARSTNFIYRMVTNSLVRGDFNNLYTEKPASYAFFDGVSYEGLPQWTHEVFREVYSISTDPLFADPANNDYHVRSFMGRYDPGISAFVTTDTNISLMVDTGPREWDYSKEPNDNGSRINIGVYANSPQASKSRTNAWIKTITGMAGGRLEGTLLLTWAFNNIDELEPVILDYSFDNGMTWTNIGTNVISAYTHLWLSDQKYPGNIERWPSSPIGRWKITLASNTNIWDMTDTYVALRNRKFIFYVNDTNTACDIYTTAPGSDTNLGIFAHSPKATLQSLLDLIDVEGEDLILIDTGTYVFDTNTVWTLETSDQGKPGLPVIIRGSTNCEGSILIRPLLGLQNHLLDIKGRYIEVEHLKFDGGGLVAGGDIILQDLSLTNKGNVSVFGSVSALYNLRVREGSVAVSGESIEMADLVVQNGNISLSGTNILLRHSLVYGTNTTPAVAVHGLQIQVINNTLSTKGSAIRQTGFGGSLIRNNILVADGFNNFCLDVSNGTIESDFNTFWTLNGAWIGGFRNGNWENLLYWQRESIQDHYSIAANPQFANAAGGDFRLKSVVGRWNGSTWVVDPVHSPAIDSGDPTLPLPLPEPMPNGSVINQGFDGNTAFASLSQTNPWMFAMTMNDGGVLKGTNYLVWRFGNMGTGDLVRLEYSPNSGTNWSTIVSGISVTDSNYLWDSTSFTSSLHALWRIVLISNTSVYDVIDQTFALRNNLLAFYVNSGSTTGNVFTSAVGNDANDGLSPLTPKLTLHNLLATYDTEGGDLIYVDTGLYPVNTPLQVVWSRGGDEVNGPLVIQGSTNLAAGGSVFRRNIRTIGNNVLEVPASHVTLRDLTLESGYQGLYVTSNNAFQAYGIFAFSNQFGVLLNNTAGAELRNMRIWNNREGGILSQETRTTVVENVTFVSNSNFSYRVQNTIADIIQNNIFYQSYTNSPALAGTTSSVESAFIDYNVYYFEQPTFIFGNVSNLLTWQLNREKDYRSAITNPLLADVSSGDFTLLSQHGRYSGGSIVFDAESSWAIDRGNPFSAYDREPAVNGNRVNIGAFGNSPFASRGTTNVLVEVRTLNQTFTISDTNAINPLIWGVINVPTGLLVNVQYSGDGGITWTNLQAGVSAYQEYIVWQANPFYNTYKGRWRIIGTEDAVVYSDTNDVPFTIFFGQFRITDIFRANGFRNNIRWRGAWDEYYQVQHSDNGFLWTNSLSGPATNQSAFFLSIQGGDFFYEDLDSTNAVDRLYRVLRNQY